MFFKLQPLIYSLAYLGLLEILAFNRHWFFPVLILTVLFSIFLVWPLARKITFLASPLFLSMSSISLLFFISSLLESQLFILFSGGVYYLSLLGTYRLKIYPCDKTAQGMINLASIATAFFFFSAVYRWFFNYAINVSILLLVIFLAVFFINWSVFNIYLSDWKKLKERFKRRKEEYKLKAISSRSNLLLLNIVVSMVIAEIAWFLHLWPFNCITTGAVITVIYYGFWDLSRNFIQYNFSCKRIIFNVILICVVSFIILLTAQWDLIV